MNGKARIFVNEKQNRDGRTFYEYRTSLSRKTDGGYENASIEVRFRKGDAPAIMGNMGEIYIRDGFLTFRKWQQDGRPRTAFYIMIMDYETEGAEHAAPPAEPVAGFEPIDREAFPF